MKRRTFLGTTAAATTLGLIGCGDEPMDSGASTTTGTTPTGGTTSTTTPLEGNALPIPPLLEGTEEGGRIVYELVAKAGTTEFYEGQPADTIGYNGSYLGPTLRARRGDPITVRVRNELGEDCTTHFHGAHLPAHADGGPHQLIPAGETWESVWDVNQPACILWYHPHLMGQTARQVYFGMAGLFLVDDADSEALDLPGRYGVDDLPLVIQDRDFTADGQLDYSLSMQDSMMGFTGSTAVVNGAVDPYVVVEAGWLRFRVLNACNGRILELSFEDESDFLILGTDLSLLEQAETAHRVVLSPGERVDILIDLSGRDGERIALKDAFLGEILLLAVDLESTVSHSPPTDLVTLPRLNPDDVVRTRPFSLSMGGAGFRINGVSMDMAVINEVIPVGEVELWEVSNLSMMTHNFHMHANHFEIVDRGGLVPLPWERGLKDTVRVEPGETVTLLVKHTDYVDDVLPYMYHCHILEHEDQGMMGQFTVIDPNA